MTWEKGRGTDYKKYPLINNTRSYERHETQSSLNVYGLHQAHNSAYGLHG